MGAIRGKGFTGVPLPLGATTLTETSRDRNPIGGPRREGIPNRPRLSFLHR
jgi:hypothetical protein